MPITAPSALLTLSCALLTPALNLQPPLPLAPSSAVTDISPLNGQYTEPGIATDPAHPDRVVAVYQGGAAAQGSGAAAYSSDSGRTFTTAPHTKVPDWRVVGDVTTAFDSHGNAFWCYLAFDRLGTTSYWARGVSRNGIFVRRSLDGGRTWQPAVAVKSFPTGREPDIQFEDEPRIFADAGPLSPYNGNLYVGWVEWQIDKSVMLFSRSTDAGLTWSQPIRIDMHPGLPRDDNGALGGFVCSVTTRGAVFAAWVEAASIVIAESRDGGRTFLHPRTAVETGPLYFGEVPGISRAAGFPQIASYASPSSNSPPDFLYITWSDYRNGDIDVFLSSSTDSGQTWASPVRVNNDPLHDGSDQFFQSTAVDPSNGDIYVFFYDTREDPRNRLLRPVLCRSTDNGKTFSNYSFTDAAFEPRGAFLGDYTWLTALDRHVWAAWTETVPPSASPTPFCSYHPGYPPRPCTKVCVGTADFSGNHAAPRQ